MAGAGPYRKAAKQGEEYRFMSVRAEKLYGFSPKDILTLK